MSDATSPKYYQFGDVQLIAVSGKLTGCGAQAVQYVARSTRMDGKNKGVTVDGRIEDLEKAKIFIDFEIDRLRAEADKVVKAAGTFHLGIGLGSGDVAHAPAYGGGLLVAAKILTVDIETQRAIVETFSLYKPFIHIDRVVKPSRILCFAAQWRGSDKVIFHAAWDDADGDAYDRMIRAAWELLNEADIVVTYNGDRFDLQWFNAEFERLKLGPPTPYKSFDLVKLTKQKFKQGLLSLKLDWSSRIYLGDRKVPHGGTDLWHDIRYGTRAERRAAQKVMREYCEHDTVLTGQLMERWLPWSKLNLSLYEDNDDELLHCVKCNGTDLKRDGVKFYATSGFLYQMYRCKSKGCRATSRGKRAQRSSELRPV